jgi:hypothetical protein
MNKYETKQQERKERYLALAQSKSAQARELYTDGNNFLKDIPLGQPIIAGHSGSEAFRRRREKALAKVGKSFELMDTAKHYEEKAQNMSTAISSDDEDAITKLKEKLAEHKELQELMKYENKLAKQEKREVAYPTFRLTNNNAIIKNVEKRIARLEKVAQLPTKADIKGNGYTLKENKEQNRIQFIFDSIPNFNTREILKQNGFRWSPKNKVWQRFLNFSGIRAAQKIINLINN